MELTKEQIDLISLIAFKAIQAGGNTKADATWQIPESQINTIYAVLQQKFGGE